MSLASNRLTSPRVSFRDEVSKIPKHSHDLVKEIKRGSEDLGQKTSAESEGEQSPSFGKRGFKSGAQGEFSGNYDKDGHHLKSDGTPDMRFKENREEYSGEGFEYTSTRGEIPPEDKSGAQGEFSGNYDKEGHHLKSDGTPDMRFKENREEYSGEGFEYTSQGRGGSLDKGLVPEHKHEEKPIVGIGQGREKVKTQGVTYEDPFNIQKSRGGSSKGGKNSMPTQIRSQKHLKEKSLTYARESKEGISTSAIKIGRSQQSPKSQITDKSLKSKQRQVESSRGSKSQLLGMSLHKKSTSKGKPSRAEHQKSDGTPDMRFKENRDEFSGEGFENTTSRNSQSIFSKANMGIYEGNLPGEHSGKFDKQGHHLKNDGTPDMRFKENREEFSGKGYEYETSDRGYSIKTPLYQMKERPEERNIYYRRRRPATPYALYIKENAPTIKKENQEMDMNQVFRELGEQWRNSSDEFKQKYYDMYNEETLGYEEINKTPHRGPLAFRKFAQQRGIKTRSDGGDIGKYSSKKGKYNLSSRISYKLQQGEQEEKENEDQDQHQGVQEIYNPKLENQSPNKQNLRNIQ